MGLPLTIKVLGDKELNEPDVLFIRKCAQCGHIFYFRHWDENHCTKCGSVDTIVQTKTREETLA